MPFANNLDQEQISREIDDFNQVVYEVCVRNDVAFIDVTTLSRTIDSNPHLIASDSLHPSGSQYAKWVTKIIPFFKKYSND